jgi:hypothetical protein
VQPQATATPDESEEALAAHGIKRGLRVEDLKPPPTKRGKGAVASVQQAGASPQAKSPQLQAESPQISAASPPAGKGRKAPVKPKAKKAKTADEPKSKAKTSADIMAEVKREIAEEEARRKAAGGSTPTAAVAKASPSSLAQGGAETAQSPSQAAEAALNARRQREAELAQSDPAGLAESAWQGLFSNSAADPSGMAAMTASHASASTADGKTLDSLLSMLGQGSIVGNGASDMSSQQGAQAPQASHGQAAAARGSPSRQQTQLADDQAAAERARLQAEADAAVEVDFFDFDSYIEDPSEFATLLGGGESAAQRLVSGDEPPAETPELVSGSNQSSTASSATSSMILQKAASLGGVGGPLSTSPMDSSDDSEPSPDDLLSSIMAGGGSAAGDGRTSQKRKSQDDPLDWWDADHAPQLQPWAILS